MKTFSRTDIRSSLIISAGDAKFPLESLRRGASLGLPAVPDAASAAAYGGSSLRDAKAGLVSAGIFPRKRKVKEIPLYHYRIQDQKTLLLRREGSASKRSFSTIGRSKNYFTAFSP